MEIDQQLVHRVKAYKASPAELETIKHVPLLFMVGISGAGKDTVLKRLVAEHPDDYQFMVSYTTRKRRNNNGVKEQNGVEYYFINVATAKKMLERGEYLETNYYANNIYGTSIAEVARGGQSHKTVIKDVDVNGVDKYMKLGMNLKPVFLVPPSYEAWWHRWVQRYGTAADQADIRRRLQTALDELESGLKHEYFYIVVNDTIEESVAKVHDIAQGKVSERREPDAVHVVESIAAEIRARLDV